MEDPETISCPLARRALVAPDAPAIIDADGESIAYDRLHRLASGLEVSLEAAGLARGDVLAVAAPSSMSFVALLVACFRRGVVIAPLNGRYPLSELRAQCREIGAKAMIDSDRLATMIQEGSSSESTWRLNDRATIIHTSGSTGRARAALHSIRNHVASARGSASNIPLGPADRWLLSLPLYHVGGLAIVFRCLLAGACIVIAERPTVGLIAGRGITHVSFVPTQLQRLLDEMSQPVPSLRTVLLGGSRIPSGLIDRALEMKLPVFTSYGLTEMSSQVCTTEPGAALDELRTAGRVLDGRQVRIDDSGRIFVRGETRFLGYVTEEGMDEPFDAEGWFATSDSGYFDSLGRLIVTGRIDEVFISGGENIHPAQIENALMAVEGVFEAVVVPVPDAEFGSRPVAFVRARSADVLRTLRTRLEDSLPRFMIPVAFHELGPPSGLKRDRQALAREAVARNVTGASHA